MGTNWAELIDDEFYRLKADCFHLGSYGFRIFNRGDSESVVQIYSHNGDENFAHFYQEVYADQALEKLKVLKPIGKFDSPETILSKLGEIKEILKTVSI